MELLGEEFIPGIDIEIIAFRTKVIVNHIEKNHEALIVCRLDQGFQLFRTAVAVAGCKKQGSVIPPVVAARKLGLRASAQWR